MERKTGTNGRATTNHESTMSSCHHTVHKASFYTHTTSHIQSAKLMGVTPTKLNVCEDMVDDELKENFVEL